MKVKIFLLSVAICIYSVSISQSVLDQMTRQQPDCYVVLKNATNVLPKLYTTQSLDSVQKGIRILQLYCVEQPEVTAELFYLTTLLHIQRSSFSINELAEKNRLSQLLYGYDANDGNETYRVRYSRYFYRLLQTWAKDLLKKPGISSTEKFVCHVLAGEYENPRAALQTRRDQYPEVYALLQNSYIKERRRGGGVLNFITGVWIPSKELKLLGTHPSVGIQGGGRGTRNEVLGTLQARFIKTPNFYTVRRQDSLYRLSYFFGWYAGLDYSHYFISKTRFEAGVAAGIGYDGFTIVANSEDNPRPELKPHSIKSLNVNGGLRFNYFLTPRFCLGIVAKYNYIRYMNAGGSNLAGQPISIDFIIGGIGLQ